MGLRAANHDKSRMSTGREVRQIAAPGRTKWRALHAAVDGDERADGAAEVVVVVGRQQRAGAGGGVDLQDLAGGAADAGGGDDARPVGGQAEGIAGARGSN